MAAHPKLKHHAKDGESPPTELFTATNVYLQRGCDWGRCSFCTEPKGTHSGSFKDYFNHLRDLRDSYGFNAFFEVSPGPSGKTLIDLLDNRPNDLEELKFRFYTYPHILTDRVIEALAELNTWEVFIGVESGDIDLLRKSRAVKIEVDRLRKEDKHYDIGVYLPDLEEQIGKLRKKGIDIKVSYIVGLEGETEDTLQKTYENSQRIIDAGATSLACSLLMPLPETRVFYKILQHPKLGQKYKREALISFDEIAKDWIKNFCLAPYETIVEYQMKIMSLVGGATAYGYKTSFSQ